MIHLLQRSTLQFPFGVELAIMCLSLSLFGALILSTWQLLELSLSNRNVFMKIGVDLIYYLTKFQEVIHQEKIVCDRQVCEKIEVGRTARTLLLTENYILLSYPPQGLSFRSMLNRFYAIQVFEMISLAVQGVPKRHVSQG